MGRVVALISGGTFMCLASTWAGAYGLGQYPHPHWANFPVFATSGIMIGYGVCLVAVGFAILERIWNNKETPDA